MLRTIELWVELAIEIFQLCGTEFYFGEIANLFVFIKLLEVMFSNIQQI